MPPGVAPFPVAPNSAQNLLISQTNTTWGLVGSGFPEFWEKFGQVIYRDTVAKMAAPCPIQYKDGWYLMLANDGISYDFKARFEPWNLMEVTGAIMAGPITAQRLDGPNQPIELRPGEDPTGLIRQVIMEKYKQWAEFLPLTLFTKQLVNGRVSTGFPVTTCYDGLPLFSTTHAINPTSKVGPSSGTLNNIVQLPGAIDESAFTAVSDRLLRFPDVDGVTLPNAMTTSRPLILAPSEATAVRWAHVLGGPQIPKELFQQANNAAITSVLVGRAEIMIFPYLVTLAESGLAFNPEKRSYVFSRSGRRPIIFREEQTPKIQNTGAQAQPAYEFNADVIFGRAYCMTGYGEYRSVVAVDEN